MLPTKHSNFLDKGTSAPTSGFEKPNNSGVRETDELPLPHDRDESISHVNPMPDPKIVQAKRDIDSGMVDTDMHATPGLDARLRKKLVPDSNEGGSDALL